MHMKKRIKGSPTVDEIGLIMKTSLPGSLRKWNVYPLRGNMLYIWFTSPRWEVDINAAVSRCRVYISCERGVQCFVWMKIYQIHQACL